ncbi:hypothetical protein HYW59_04255 [Candidatus Kaiserbacteria bacterium]|nr:hypothetical protein [Candidatus Kaiserbacteria bacterium]
MAKKKEDKFDKLARLIKQEGEDVRGEIKSEIGGLEKRMNEKFADVDKRFTGLERRLDNTMQKDLDEHARRIKILEIKMAQR